jgi:hypothetical protein
MGVGVNVLFKTHFVFRLRRLLDPLSDMVITRHKDGIHVEKLSDFEEHHDNPGKTESIGRNPGALP